MKLTKTQAALEAAQKGRASLMKRIATEKDEGIRTAAIGGTGLLIGNLEASGRMRDVPQIGPLPRTVTLALLAKAGAMFIGPGKAKAIVNGIGDGAVAVAAYNFSRGAQISGTSNRGVLSRERAEAERLERSIEDRVSGEDSLEGALSGRL